MLLSLPFRVHAQTSQEPFSVEVEYASDKAAKLAVLWITPDVAHYVYAEGGGNAKPVRVEASEPGSSDPAPDVTVLYVPGTVRKDFFEPDKYIPVYENRFPIFIRVPDGGPQELTARLSLLLCSPDHCVPARRDLSLAFPPAAPSVEGLPWKNLLRKAAPSSYAPSVAALSPTAPQRQAVSAPSFPESSKGSTAFSGLKTAAASPSALSRDAANWNLTPRYVQADLEPLALGPALLLGLLAGLILNVMPCVLPVLTIKITALLNAVSNSGADALGRFRVHNLLFAAGILTWFIALAGIVGGMGLAWGGLFQQSGVIYGLLILIFLLGLSLFDVFTLPVLDFKLSSNSSPRLQAYLTGLVATLLATPCSGPLLGGVLGWAVLQPLPVLFMVFTAAGLGMAAPYLAFAIWPAAGRFLPRPGAWTGVMERLIGFFLMGTALYLLSILPEKLRLPALAVLLICALSAWIWGQWGSPARPLSSRLLAGSLALLLAGSSVAWSLQPAPPPVAWESFTSGTFRASLGRERLLVEFTADWCPTCKVLEKTTLTPARLETIRRHYGLKLIRVDLTRPSPEAEALLRALGSVSIPLTALFPSGPKADSPLVLRDIYTPAQLDAALREAF